MDAGATLKIIVLICFLFLLFVAVSIAIRRWVRTIYFLRLDRERKRLKPKVEMFLERKIPFNSVELKYLQKTIRWQVVEYLLLKAKETVPEENKIHITRLFERLKYPTFYQKILKTGNRWQRSLAADKLGRIGSSNATRYLLEALKDPCKEVRSVALRSLAMICDPRALPFIIMKLPQIASTQDGVFVSILKNGLVNLGEPAVPFLLSKIDKYDEKMRSIIIECLGEIGSRKAIRILINKLADTSPEIRAKAAKALGKIGDPSAVPNLLGMGNEPIWFVRLQICRALGIIKDPRGIDLLAKMLIDENWQVRAASAESLRRISYPAFSVLAATLTEGEDRYAKEQVAEEMQRSGIVDELINSLDHPEDRVKKSGKRLLLSLATLGVTSLIEKAVETHPSEKVRVEAGEILRSLESARLEQKEA